MKTNIDKIVRNVLRDIRVELMDEFDKNFERQAFFSEKWQRRKSPLRPGGHTLVDTGTLRRSLESRSDGNRITFRSTLPYAAIHNEGGTIKVTQRMKRYFWHKYYEASGSLGRRKNGELRQTQRNKQLNTEAAFWRAMALMPEEKEIKIPKRQFLGLAPEVERAVREIIEDNIKEIELDE